MFNYDCVSFSSSIVYVPYVIILSVSICISSLLVWISINTFKTYESHVTGILALHGGAEGHGSTPPGAVHDVLIHVGDLSGMGLQTMNSFLSRRLH